MSTPRIQSYLLKEIALPASLGVLVFTFVLLMGRVLRLVELVINKGVPFLEIVNLFLYLLPSFLVITLPVSFLLGVIIGFSRLSVDSEITALKSTGVSLYAMARPILLSALPVCLVTACLTLFIEPAGNVAFRSQVFQIAKSRASVGFQPRVFNDEFDGLVLYANNIDERSGLLEGVFISDERIGSNPSIILAGRGRLIDDPATYSLTLRLDNGSIHRQQAGRAGKDSSYQTLSFSTYDINLNMGQELPSSEKRRKKESELSMSELREAIQEAPNPEAERAYRVQWHRRFALPFAPVSFALIAIPLGLLPHRSSRGGGLAMALMIFLGYYLCFTFVETLALGGALPLIPALWLPNLLFLSTGALLLWLKAGERDLGSRWKWLNNRRARKRCQPKTKQRG